MSTGHFSGRYEPTGSAHLRSLNDFSFARFEKPVISGRFQAVSEIPKPLEKQSVPNPFIIPLFASERKDFDTFFEFFFPMDSKVSQAWDISNPEWARKVFEVDKQELLQADMVIAIYDSHYSDSGTAWELGYAHAMGIPVKLLCTDLKSSRKT